MRPLVTIGTAVLVLAWPGEVKPQQAATIRPRSDVLSREAPGAQESIDLAKQVRERTIPAERALARADVLADRFLASETAERLAPAVAERRLAAEALMLYAAAVETGTPQEAALATNEIGNLHLVLGDAHAAVATFSRLELTAVPDEQRFVVRFNRGRALEDAGDALTAWDDYHATLRSQPAFRPAVEGAWRTLVVAGDPAAPERAAKLAELLLERGEHGSLAEVLWPALERWATPSLFAVLARWWSAAPPAADGLPQAERERLTSLTGHDAIAQRLAQGLTLAFAAGDFDAAVRRAAGGEEPLANFISARFEGWRGAGQGSALANLLASLADADRRRGAQAAAVGRGFAAWSIDGDFVAAAFDCAAALRAEPSLDPRGLILGEIVRGAENLPSPPRAARDVLRLHLLLASIFELRGAWDPAGSQNTVLHQLRRALAAEKELTARDPAATLSPALHRRLGEAYRRAGDGELAFTHFLLAAESLADRERLDEAGTQLQAAQNLEIAPDPARWERLAELTRRIHDTAVATNRNGGAPPV